MDFFSCQEQAFVVLFNVWLVMRLFLLHLLLLVNLVRSVGDSPLVNLSG